MAQIFCDWGAIRVIRSFRIEESGIEEFGLMTKWDPSGVM